MCTPAMKRIRTYFSPTLLAEKSHHIAVISPSPQHWLKDVSASGDSGTMFSIQEGSEQCSEALGAAGPPPWSTNTGNGNSVGVLELTSLKAEPADGL